MKKNLILVLVFVSVALFVKAQGKFEVHAGGSFPTGDFASTESDDGGGAGTGFNVGVKYYLPLRNVEGLSLTLGLDLLHNGISQDAKDISLESFEGTGVTNLGLTYWNYINVPLLAGLDYKFNLNKSLDLFGDVALGVNYSKLTDLIMTLNYEGTPVKTTMSFDPLTNFAFQLGAGVLINQQYSVGLHYFALGNYKYKGSMLTEAMGQSQTTNDPDMNNSVTISTLSLALGIRF